MAPQNPSAISRTYFHALDECILYLTLDENGTYSAEVRDGMTDGSSSRGQWRLEGSRVTLQIPSDKGLTAGYLELCKELDVLWSDRGWALLPIGAHFRQLYELYGVVGQACFVERRKRTDQELYHAYLSMVASNGFRNVDTPSPLLIDTNNLSPKLTKTVLNLPTSLRKGQLGEIRLGMTMEQVGKTWGKPYWFWSRCYGGPRFCYGGGVSVIFDPSSNSVSKVLWIRHEPPDFPRFSAGLKAMSSGVEEFVRVLGKPSSRKDSEGTDSCELVYSKTAASLRLEFDGRSPRSLYRLALESARSERNAKSEGRMPREIRNLKFESPKGMR